MQTNLNFTAIFEEVSEGGYIAYIEEMQGVNAQGDNLDEAKANLLDALNLMVETKRMISASELGDRKVIKETLELLS